MDWGRKLPDKDAGKPLPKPVNFKEDVLRHVQGTWGSRVRKLTLTTIIRHLVGDDTAYFTARPLDGETLLCVDIDCHASGTLKGAKQFAQFLKENYFPNLYIETSTHGNGAHGFVVVDRSFWSDAQYKAVLVALEKWLKRVLRSTTFDVEDVELKGTPMTVQWGSRRREARSVTYGSLAKMPRDWQRFGEWQATTCMTAHELRELPERFPVAEPEAEHREESPAPKVAKGSVLGKLVDPEVVRKLEPLARDLLDLQKPEVGSASRAVVVAEDVQMTLAVIRAFTLHPNPDGSIPVMRAKAIWDRMHEAGDTSRAFNFHRFAAIRNMLTDLGLLEWEDSTYRFGRACRWKASEELMERMESVLSGSDTTTPFAPSTVVCNMVAEAQRKRPEQVGLRPKMTFPSLLRTGLGRGTGRIGAGTPRQTGCVGGKRQGQ